MCIFFADLCWCLSLVALGALGDERASFFVDLSTIFSCGFFFGGGCYFFVDLCIIVLMRVVVLFLFDFCVNLSVDFLCALT